MDLASDRVVVSARLVARRREVRAERRRRRRKIIAGVVLTVLLAFGAYSLSRSLLFGLSDISVVGATHVDERDVIAASGLRRGQNAMGIDLDAVAVRVRGVPGVRNASVERDGSLGIRISIVERRPALEIRIAGERRYLDQDGRPISGVKPDGAIPVVAVEGGASTLLPPGTAATVRFLWDRLPADLRDKIDTFAVPDDGAITFAMGKTTVLFGTLEHVDEKIEALKMVRSRVRKERRAAIRIDLRAPSRPAVVLR